MSSFLNFIDEDIEAKKILFSTMPTKTKTDKRKFNDKITSVSDKYQEYKKAVKKYLDTKSKSFYIKKSNDNIEELRNRVTNLEHVRFILNPTNTYFEKMGFDNLFYEIGNYYDFNFSSLNEIINKFLDKFELVDIKLFSVDFDYTCYVNEYMASFLEVRTGKSQNYDKVSEIFEKIYWVNPEIIQHIELNFRKLIRKNEKKFTNYVIKIQKEVLLENKISNYQECLDKLKVAYFELDNAEKENICDIIDLAKSGAIDITNYFKDSKIRTSTYSTLMIDSSSLEDKAVMDRFYENLEKLKVNIEEYGNYIKFLPLIDAFKSEYAKQISTDDKNSNRSNVSKNLKSLESQIIDKETKLEKMNKKIFNGEMGFFEAKNNDTKQLRIDSVKQAKELYELYKTYNQEYFRDKVLAILNNSLTISELLHFYYSFDYFKKITIKKVFNITNHDDIVKYSDSFDLYAMNPTNIVTNDVPVFEENNIAKVIMNKYRLDNINLTDENLDFNNLEMLMDKIQLLLRINEIENSPTTIEKIWFMVAVERFNAIEDKKE